MSDNEIPSNVIEAMAEEISFSGCLYCENDKFVELRAALKAAEQAGWKLVPVEPTEEMLKAASETKAMQAVDSCLAIAAIHGCGLHRPDSSADAPLAHAYRAMIAASPEVG